MLLATATILVHPPGSGVRVLVFASMAAATAGLARSSPGRWTGFVRDWLPVGEVLLVFLLLQPIIEATVPWRADAVLAELDRRYLGGLVEAWHGAFGRPAPFTDAVYLAYLSYYFLPITVAAVAWRRGPETFERVVFAVLLGFYLTFVGYLLMPATGPRLAGEEEARQLGGGAISDAARAFLHAAESTTLDAFPSGHTTVAVVSGVLGSGLLGWMAAVALWAWAVAIVFATVYIHVHYASDIVAGLVFAIVVLLACRLRADAARGRESQGRARSRIRAFID
jgi:membrane-associated phospholipid phosphatase